MIKSAHSNEFFDGLCAGNSDCSQTYEFTVATNNDGNTNDPCQSGEQSDGKFKLCMGHSDCRHSNNFCGEGTCDQSSGVCVEGSGDHNHGNDCSMLPNIQPPPSCINNNNCMSSQTECQNGLGNCACITKVVNTCTSSCDQCTKDQIQVCIQVCIVYILSAARAQGTANQICSNNKPVITHYDPVEGTTIFDGSQNIVLTFNQDVVAGNPPTDSTSYSGYIFLIRSGGMIKIPVNDPNQVTFSSNQVTINPAQDLVAAT